MGARMARAGYFSGWQKRKATRRRGRAAGDALTCATAGAMPVATMSKPRSQHHELTVPEEFDGARLDQALAGLLAQYSRSALKHWIEAGDAALNGAPARPRARVRSGDRVSVTATLDAAEAHLPQAVRYDVLHSDDDLVVVDKPAGVVVHPGAGNRDRTLVNGLIARFPELSALPRAGLVHRIDKDTSGVLLVARNPASYQALVRAMAAREIARTYDAIVTGVLVAGGVVDQPIGRDPRQRTRMRVVAAGRPATTHYRIDARYRAHTRLAVTLETGRTHQIRVHMAWLGHPLVGDARYGARPRPPRDATPALRELLQGFPRQALHAARLALRHPVSGAALAFRAPTPPDLAALAAALAEDAELHAGE